MLHHLVAISLLLLCVKGEENGGGADVNTKAQLLTPVDSGRIVPADTVHQQRDTRRSETGTAVLIGRGDVISPFKPTSGQCTLSTSVGSTLSLPPFKIFFTLLFM